MLYPSHFLSCVKPHMFHGIMHCSVSQLVIFAMPSRLSFCDNLIKTIKFYRSLVTYHQNSVQVNYFPFSLHVRYNPCQKASFSVSTYHAFNVHILQVSSPLSANDHDHSYEHFYAYREGRRRFRLLFSSLYHVALFRYLLLVTMPSYIHLISVTPS
jgi:hypothetical protein